MQLLTNTGTYAPYESDSESIARLEVYRLSEDEMREIEERSMSGGDIMEFLELENQHYLVEPGAWYIERNFVAYNEISGVLVIEVRKSLNI